MSEACSAKPSFRTGNHLTPPIVPSVNQAIKGFWVNWINETGVWVFACRGYIFGMIALRGSEARFTGESSGGRAAAWAGLALLAMAATLPVRSSPAADAGDFRQLAPGVLTVVPADVSMDEAIRRGPLLEITEGQRSRAWKPQRAASNTTFVERGRWLEYPRDIWCLEFAFKPPRRIDIDIPAADDQMRRVTVWYLVYRVKNVGGRRLVLGTDDEGKPDPAQRSVETFEKPVRFLPHFVLESLEGLTEDEGLTSYRAYLDRLVPSAMDAIRRREDPARQFLDSAAMAATAIQPGEERWGVAIWEAVDPRIDYFSIYVRGLTNAIAWRKRAEATIGPDDPPGKHMEEALESLRLDFWWPGDGRAEKDVSIGYRGMFERMALGGRVLAALSWPAAAKSRPAIGLERLGLAWNDPGLAEPAGEGPATSLRPLETVFLKLAGIEDRPQRAAVAQDLFGDVGLEAIKQLAAEATGPVEPDREQERRRALAALELTPEAVAAKPLDSLAKIARELDSAPDAASRRERAAAIFGPTADRLAWLRRVVVQARLLAALDTTEADPPAIARLDARAAFDAVADAVASAPPDQRDQLVTALFGPRGIELFAAAREQHEGVDYAWVLRYENPE